MKFVIQKEQLGRNLYALEKGELAVFDTPQEAEDYASKNTETKMLNDPCVSVVPADEGQIEKLKQIVSMYLW